MATTVLYRISSNEVIAISAQGELFDIYSSAYYGVLSDPPFTDGTEYRDPSGNKNVFGYAKINDNGTIRNATQNEIDTFAGFEQDDNNQIQATKASNYFQSDPKFRRIMTAFADILVDEFNILRAEHGLNDRTLSQLKTAIINRISKDD